MAECYKCKKELSRISVYYYNHKGKNYCRNCYYKVTAKEMKEQEKEKHIRDANMAILKEYNTNARKFIIDIIKDWKPRNCKNETDYTESLKKFLDKELTHIDIYVGKESGLDSSRLDLVVGKKKPYREFAIELKKDLNSSPQFDRLKGQIHTYVVGKFKHIVIVLIGKTEAKFETELKKYNKEILDKYCSMYRYSKFDLNAIDVIKKK